MNRGMNQYYQEALRKCLAGLVQSIPSILDLVLVKMNMHFLPIQQETIQSQPNSVAKVTEFVKILTTMTNEAFHTFLGVLDQLHYRHVANEIRLAANMPVQVPPHSTLSSSSPMSMIPAPPTTGAAHGDIFTQKPKMALVKGICDYIAAHWMDIAYSLDFDPDGNQVDLIEQQGARDPKRCCELTLKTWIQGTKGKQPQTWQTLLDILISLDHKAAHDKVKEYLQYVQSQKQRSRQDGQDSIEVSQSVQETHPDTSMQQSLPLVTSERSLGSLRRLQNNQSLPREPGAHQVVGSSDEEY